MSMKIVVADPDWRFAQKAVRYLESHAHLVVSIAEAKMALARIKQWRPDLVILAAELADQGMFNDIHSLLPRPAVLLTEHMARYDRAWRAWQMGGDELLMKPVFRSEELLQGIIVALENATVGSRGSPSAASA